MQMTRCTKCMEELPEGVRVCPHCGYEQDSVVQPGIALKRNTILHGRYLIGNVIGQGGFGITYVGWDLTLEMKVAVKEYFPSGSASRTHSISNEIEWDSINQDSENRSDGMERFLKEARRMARLDEVPSIVRVRDAFGENQTAYIVMDFVEGVTLKKYLLGHGVLRYDECMKLLSPILDSLAVIHDHGFIHRDISPDNIMLRPDGSARLLDMGAAVDVTANGGHASMAVIKRNFSAPEQYMESERLGSWTDVYAMGATIYYCMTGKVVPEALEREFKKAPLYFDPGLNIPGHVVEALSGALELHAEKRIRDMREFKRRLAEPEKEVRPEQEKEVQPGPEALSRPGRRKEEEEPGFQDIPPTTPYQADDGEMKATPAQEEACRSEEKRPEEKEPEPSRDLNRNVKKGHKKRRMYFGIAAGILLVCAVFIFATIKKYEPSLEGGGIFINRYPYEGERYVKLPDRILGLPVVGISWGYGHHDFTALEEVVLPKKLQTIDYASFRGATNLKKIELPEGITTIDWLAFLDTGLPEITIPSTVDTLECGSCLLDIPQVNIAENNQTYKMKDGMICKSNGELTAFPRSREGVFVIPSEFHSIGKSAFEKTSLSEVTIPGSVAVVGWMAFADGDNLQKVVIENGVKELGSSCFRSCESLGEVTIPASVKRIGSWAFYGTSLSEITIPGGVTVVEDLAFAQVQRLRKVVIEDGVEELDDNSFEGCESLSEITIPKSVKRIGERAFMGCESLKSVTVSRDCQIDSMAFESDVEIKYYD